MTMSNLLLAGITRRRKKLTLALAGTVAAYVLTLPFLSSFVWNLEPSDNGDFKQQDLDTFEMGVDKSELSAAPNSPSTEDLLATIENSPHLLNSLLPPREQKNLKQISNSKRNRDRRLEASSSASINRQMTSTQECPQEPCNINIVMMGDSLMRYSYVSLAYYLRHGRWYNHTETPYCNLLVARDHKLPTNHHFYLNWYNDSTAALAPYDNCDCFRFKILNSREGYEALCENRYYFDPIRNNTVVYFSAFGTKLHQRGHWNDPHEAMRAPLLAQIDPNFKHPNPDNGAPNVGPLGTNYSYSWRHSMWGDLIRDQVGKLKPNALVMNAGHWWNLLDRPDYAQDVYNAVQEVGIPKVVWRTTTSAIFGDYEEDVDHTDHKMCQLFQLCINVSYFTSLVPPEHYTDRLHFRGPVYRRMNEYMLHVLGIPYPSKDRMRWSDIGVVMGWNNKTARKEERDRVMALKKEYQKRMTNVNKKRRLRNGLKAFQKNEQDWFDEGHDGINNYWRAAPEEWRKAPDDALAKMGIQVKKNELKTPEKDAKGSSGALSDFSSSFIRSLSLLYEEGKKQAPGWNSAKLTLQRLSSSWNAEQTELY